VRLTFLLSMMPVLALAGVLSACEDEVTDPEALLASAEAEQVMRSADALPGLGDLIDRAGTGEPTDRAALLRARELWDAGSTAGDARARSRRRLAVAYAVPVLVPAMPEAEWAGVREATDSWMSTAASMLQHLPLPEVERSLERAQRHLARADAVTDAAGGRPPQYHLLLALSELVETTPRHVARSLAADAAAAVRRAETAGQGGEGEPGASVSAPSLERATRLKDWAARAVEEGEYLLAIQRAYYAIQLVEER
jgi:hypothetical protein